MSSEVFGKLDINNMQEKTQVIFAKQRNFRNARRNYLIPLASPLTMHSKVKMIPYLTDVSFRLQLFIKLSFYMRINRR